jgi:hypothetical protein
VRKDGHGSFGWGQEGDEEGGKGGKGRNRRTEQPAGEEENASEEAAPAEEDVKVESGWGAEATIEQKPAAPEEEPDTSLTYEEFRAQQAAKAVECDQKEARKVANDNSKFKGKEIAKEEIVFQIELGGTTKQAKTKSKAANSKKILSLDEFSASNGSDNRGGRGGKGGKGGKGGRGGKGYRGNISLNEQNFPKLG